MFNILRVINISSDKITFYAEQLEGLRTHTYLAPLGLLECFKAEVTKIGSHGTSAISPRQMHRVTSPWLQWLNCMTYTDNYFPITVLDRFVPSEYHLPIGRPYKDTLYGSKKSSPKLKCILRLK